MGDWEGVDDRVLEELWRSLELGISSSDDVGSFLATNEAGVDDDKKADGDPSARARLKCKPAEFKEKHTFVIYQMGLHNLF